MSCCGGCCGCGGCGCGGCGCCPSNRCCCGNPILITTDCMAPLCPGFCCPRVDCIPCCPCGINALDGCGYNPPPNARC